MNKQRAHIIVVNDGDQDLLTLGSILNSSGFNISFVRDSQTALEIIFESIPDMILLDVNMPDMDGYELCSLLKKREITRDIPVILLSDSVEDKDVISGFSLGASDYISKPFNPKELLARIHTHLRLKKNADKIKKLNYILKKNHKNITDSIIYAKRIQSALLPSSTFLGKFFPQNFILYKPKDIVSGDFFWFEEINNYLYIATADCTGHGVSGAFMSILSMSLIFQIHEETRITNRILPPNEILNKLRDRVVHILNKDRDNPEIEDGLDISLMLIDLKTLKVQFAGANQSLSIISRIGEIAQDSLIPVSPLRIIHGDRMPIGFHLYMNSDFTNHEFSLMDGDLLYLWSDGYLSQIGGKKNRVFGTKQMRDMVLEIKDEPLDLQKKALEQRLTEWRGNNSQTDDILIIGFKVDFNLLKNSISEQ